MNDDRKPSAVDVTVCSLSEGEGESDASDLVETGGSNEKKRRKDVLRERNALYARRKYARRKIESDVLHGQCLQLEESNHYLRLEEARLRGLVDRAQQMVQMHGHNQNLPMYSSLFSSVNPYRAVTLPLPYPDMAESLLMQELARQQAHTTMLQGHSLPFRTTNTYLPAPVGGLLHDTVRLNNLYSGTLRADLAQTLLTGVSGGYQGIGVYSSPMEVLNSLRLQQQTGQLCQHHWQSGHASATKAKEDDHVPGGHPRQKDR